MAIAKMVTTWKDKRVEDGSWDQIFQLLELCRKEHDDYFRIDNYSEKEGEAEIFSVDCDKDSNFFMPALDVYLDLLVLYYDNPAAEGKYVIMDDIKIPDRYLTDDFDLIVSMAREFYETGWVKGLKKPEDMEGKLPPSSVDYW